MSRRDFIGSTAAASLATGAGSINAEGAGIAAAKTAAASPKKMHNRVPPVIVASSNGFTMKNGGQLNCVETAFERMAQGDDTLDSLLAGVNIVELDPEDASVGYGGRPNADGVVQLDACCMHGRRKQAGGVAALEGVRTPSLVAKAVMDNTDHHLLVGRGAQDFARMMGFTIEDDLNTEKSRRQWLEWKRRIDPRHYLDPKTRFDAAEAAAKQMLRDGIIGDEEYYGTINCNGINANGEICGVTTTSGLAWKIPGRVGDSPILGAGLYVDDVVGAAGSTGRGEANLYGLCSFLIVEEMRRGRHPTDAGMEALRRIKANTLEPRLLNDLGQPNFNVKFYILDRMGRYAGVALYASGDSARYAVCTENGAEHPMLEPLLDGAA